MLKNLVLVKQVRIYIALLLSESHVSFGVFQRVAVLI